MEKNDEDSPYGGGQDYRDCIKTEKRRAWVVRCCCCDIVDFSGSAGDRFDLGIFERMVTGIMGSDHRKSRRNFIKYRSGRDRGKQGRFKTFATFIKKDTAGDAVVEATILFPIMIMIFAALVLLSIFLPARAALQRATQYAAIVIAAEISDTWLFYDEGSMSFYRESDIRNLKNVYVDLFSGVGDVQSKGEAIVRDVERSSISSKAGNLSVESEVLNRIIYKEAIVTATREFPMPVDLSFIGFPKTISVTATSAVFVQNSDEFIRNIDMASDFLEFIIDKYNLHNLTNAIGSFGSRVTGLLGW